MIIGCTIFYDDGVELLEACLKSLKKVADKIITVDGAFSDFPHKNTYSSKEMQEIALKYSDSFISASSTTPWKNQAEKRNAYVEAALKYINGNHILVLDADEIIQGKKPTKLKEDFYSVKFSSANKTHPQTSVIRLIKLHPGMTYLEKHNVLIRSDGTPFNLGEPKGIALLSGLEIIHNPEARSRKRLEQDGEYLRNRKENAVPLPKSATQALQPSTSVVLEVLHLYRGFSNEGEHLEFHPGDKVSISPGTAARLLTDFPAWFKKGA